MTSVEEHYRNLLAPIYLWMAGGIEAALAQGREDVGPFLPGHPGSRAIDLGAGFGMHAIPLARNGWTVTAIDTSPVLLAELERHARGLNVQAIQADLRDFRAHVSDKVDLVLCMGDTITHLQETSHVARLLEEVAGALAPGGRLVVTFRDYTRPLAGDARFVPVRSDAQRIHTCFLEEHGERMAVYDLVHERDGASWRLRVSSYAKLRIAPDWMVQAIERAGLAATLEAGPRGMIRLVATLVNA